MLVDLVKGADGSIGPLSYCLGLGSSPSQSCIAGVNPD